MRSVLLLALFLTTLSADVRAQQRCVTPQEAAKIIGTITSPNLSADHKAFRNELFRMEAEYLKLHEVVFADFGKDQSRLPALNALGESNLVHLCGLLKQNGWPSRDIVKQDGVEALQFVAANNRAVNMQRELLPVLIAASKEGDVSRALLADLVDRIRVNAGLPQIFGTQSSRRGDVMYILPLLNDQKVEAWRAFYNLPPLDDQIRGLEERFLLPVAISPRLSGMPGASRKDTKDVQTLGLADSDAPIKVETNLVNINARVFTSDLKTPYGVTLSKSDLVVVEDGLEQNAQFFSTEAAPFDLVLVLDFSGSTAEKRNLIKKAAKRFVGVARPNDRVAMVAFADEIKLVSALTSDKEAITTAIDKLKLDGQSPVWDAFKFAHEKVVDQKPSERRTAIVFMTDGEDNASKSTFADALEMVRHGDTTVFSIFLNTFDAKPSDKNPRTRVIGAYHLKLSMLAEESGGQFYKANNLKDLNGIYEQVVSDIGKIYSIGYEPKNEKRDGGWRSIEIQVKTHPELVVKTRRGYYAD
jgi:Ca-activated chloride channel family protein